MTSTWDELLMHGRRLNYTHTSTNIIAKTSPIMDCSGGVSFYFNLSDEQKEAFKRAQLKKIIYNGPATIVFWTDGTKTIVKRSKKDKYNKYNAFCAALAKKIFGSNNKIINIVKNGKEE